MARRRTSVRSAGSAGRGTADGRATDGGGSTGDRPGLASLTARQTVRLVRALWSERGCRTRAVRRGGSIYVLCVCPTDGRREVVEVAAASDVAPSTVERLAAVRNRLGYDAAAYVSLRFAAGTTTESVEILGRAETRAVIAELDVRAAVESAFDVEVESVRTGDARAAGASTIDGDRTARADTCGGGGRGAVTQLSYSADERAAALVSQALGDSVTERRLLATGPAGPLSEASLAEHLPRSEQPQFLLENRWRGVTSDRHGTIAPDDDYRTLAALTGERVFVVVGTHDGDLTISLPYGAITGVESSAGVTKRRLTVETDDDVYDLWASADAIGETELAAATEFVANRCDEGAVWTESAPHVSAFESHAVETTRRELLQRAVGYGGGVLRSAGSGPD